MYNKKDDHLKLALKFHRDKHASDFDEISFINQVFSDVDCDSVNTKTSFAGFKTPHPFYINGMTGGSELTKGYNEKLAILARETDTPMASGSIAWGLQKPELLESFKIIRESNPNGIVLTNIGADKTLDDAKRAVDIMKADGIQVHLNICQELVMPEGDRYFGHWLDHIRDMVDHLGVPVIVKEVGFGMSKKAIDLIYQTGAKTVDVAGKGGTDFAKIENYRRVKDKYDFLEGYGNTTAQSLLEAKDYMDKLEILASGGIRNSMDIVKVLAMGAKSAGMAARFLNLVDSQSLDNAIIEVNNWKYQIQAIMTLLGAHDISQLRDTDLLISGSLREYAETRGIDYKYFANRKK